MMRVRISLTLYLSEMFRSLQTGLSIVTEAMHWTILDKRSALDPSSGIMAPRYLKLDAVWNFWPLAFISL